ncbi:MAG: ferritin-like domain-containing protein [Thermomicrobiales bacterium]
MAIQDRPNYESMLQRAMNARLHPLSRRSLVRTSALAGAGLAAINITGIAAAQSGEATPAIGTMSSGESPFTSDVDVLNYALKLEHLEHAFYRDGLAMLGVDGFTTLGFQPGVFDFLSEIGAHEAAHVETLTGVISQLGGEPVAEATYDFGYTDAAGFLKVSQALEDTGVSAYQGAAQYLMDNGDLLTAALTIHGVEARHAAYVAVLNAADPFPAAVNPTLTPAEVLDIATPFITSGS